MAASRRGTVLLVVTFVVNKPMSRVHDSDSDSDESCLSELDAAQEDVLSELLEDSAPDSTLGQDKSHRKTWVAACAKAGTSQI